MGQMVFLMFFFVNLSSLLIQYTIRSIHNTIIHNTHLQCVKSKISTTKNPCILVKSTQYKKLPPNVLQFTYQNLKSCKNDKRTLDS